jgi:xanthine dehydrogenase YagS FAD-binding subunit
MISFQYVKANSANSAVSLSTKSANSSIIAGGTNLVDLMKRGVTAPEKLIDITALPLKDISFTNNMMHIGALASNSNVAENALVVAQFPLLSMALHAGASPQLRNMATVGGNMMQRTRCAYFYDTTMPCNKRVPASGCGALEGYNRMHAIFGASPQCIAVHPSDMCVASTALNAKVIINTTKGERSIAFADFHRLPGTTPEKDNNLQKGELIIRIEIPANNLQKHSHYLKVRDRTSYAFALVSVAAGLELKDNKIVDVRLAMGGVAHKPWRLSNAEMFLKGKEATVANFEAAAKIAMQGARSYGENDFKLKMAPLAIVDALSTAANKA